MRAVSIGNPQIQTCCCVSPATEVQRPWGAADLCAQSDTYRGTAGYSEGNGGLGFRPAFLDADTGIVYCSCFLDGNPAPVHLLDGLAAQWRRLKKNSGPLGSTCVSGSEYCILPLPYGPESRLLRPYRTHRSMHSLFEPRLVNDAFGDPTLYVDFRDERRALLFDLGDISVLPPRKLMRLSHVFVTHTHMDHFSGFDQLLRVVLGRKTRVVLFGGPDFVAQVEHKLRAYTWNVVHRYEVEFVIEVREIGVDGRGQSARFSSRAAIWARTVRLVRSRR